MPAPDDAVPPCPNPAPLHGEPDAEAPAVIVVFRDGVPHHSAARALAARVGFHPQQVYESVLPGFVAELSPAQLALVRCDPDVAYVEYDRKVQFFAGPNGPA